MPASSTSIEMRLTGVDGASALLDAATERLGRLQRKSRSTLDTVLSGARTAGRALLLDAPRAAIHGLRNGLLGVAAAATAIGYATDRAAARLGTLSDQAAQAGTTSDQLQRLANALQEAGAHAASTENLAAALSKMTKATGRTGLEGLRETLAEIASLPDEGKRVAALSETFGRALGPQLAVTVRQGPEALLEGFDRVVAAMPGVEEEVVQAGDSIADGMKSVRTGIANAWDTLLVGTADRIAAHFGMSARELGATIAAYATHYAGVALDNLGPLWDRLVFIGTHLPALGRAALTELGNAVDRFLRDHLAPVLKATHAIGNALRAASEWATGVGEAVGTLIAGGSAREALDAYAEGLGHAAGELTAAPRKIAEAGEAWNKAMSDFEGRDWVGVTNKRAEDLEKNLAKIKGNLDEGMNKFAKGAADAADEAEESGVDAADKVRDAWKQGGAVIAGSYDDLRVRLQRTASAAVAAARTALASSTTSGPSSSSSTTSPTDPLYTLQRDNWARLHQTLSNLALV